MKYLTHVIFYWLIVIHIAHLSRPNPPKHYYYLSTKGVKCSLITMSAYISVSYETTTGIRLSELSFDNRTSDQTGICGEPIEYSKSTFNISTNEKENLIFVFQNIDNKVILKSIDFIYQLPNINFPNATAKGTMMATSNINQTLSTLSQFFQCLSYTEFNLSNGVTFHLYGIKLKVFNVKDDSFGDNGVECPHNLISSSNGSAITTTVSKETSSRIPPPETVTTETKTTATTECLTYSTTRTSMTTILPAYAKFIIRNESTICLLLQGQMSLSVTYKAQNKDITKQFPVMWNSPYSGICAPNINNVTIRVNENVNFSLTFTKKATRSILSKFQVYIFLSALLFPNATNENASLAGIFYSDCLGYEVNVGKEYYCKNKLTLGNASINLETMDFKFEAFRTSNSTEFSNQVSAKCPNGLTTGQMFAMLLFGLMVTVILGLSVVSLIRKCARYYRYQKVQLNESM